jgi:hypothetical protein
MWWKRYQATFEPRWESCSLTEGIRLSEFSRVKYIFCLEQKSEENLREN